MNPVRARHFVYVLQNKEGAFYTGCTSDLKNRIKQHQNKMSKFTKHRGPYDLVYYEACVQKEDAYRREKYLKTGMGKRYLKNRIITYLEKEF